MSAAAGPRDVVVRQQTWPADGLLSGSTSITPQTPGSTVAAIAHRAAIPRPLTSRALVRHCDARRLGGGGAQRRQPWSDDSRISGSTSMTPPHRGIDGHADPPHRLAIPAHNGTLARSPRRCAEATVRPRWRRCRGPWGWTAPPKAPSPAIVPRFPTTPLPAGAPADRPGLASQAASPRSPAAKPPQAAAPAVRQLHQLRRVRRIPLVRPGRARRPTRARRPARAASTQGTRDRVNLRATRPVRSAGRLEIREAGSLVILRGTGVGGVGGRG